MYTVTQLHYFRDRLLVIRNLVSATRTGLELQAPAVELLPDVETAIRELTGIRDSLRKAAGLPELVHQRPVP
jgi:hypothetical protein